MGTIWIKQLTGGLDTRRSPEVADAGSLVKLEDAHTDRGGEAEQRAAFIKTHILPASETKGLAYTRAGLVVFGSAATPPGIPAGITYVRLQHTDIGRTLTKIKSWDLFQGKIYVAAEFDDGSLLHFYDGVRVDDWFDGRARASFNVVSGSGVLAMTALKVGGISVVGGSVAWSVGAEEMAADIAAAVNAHTSSPDYEATAVGNRVNIISNIADDADNGKLIEYTVAAGLVFSPTSPIPLANGVDPTITSFQPGDFVRTIGSKMYSVSGPNLHFSGIKLPTQFTTDAVGAGFIDMSTEASGLEELKAVVPYQNFVAVFADRTIAIWYVDPDPTLNKKAQILNNTGTVSAKSITQFGDEDVFYCDESGIRSLRARDSSNSASTTDTGIPVDSLIVEQLGVLTEDEKEKIIGVIEPRDGRFWLAMKDVIFVFSYFGGSKISAWSTYLPTYIDDDETIAFDIDEMTVFDKRVWLRSGDEIFVYGSTDGPYEHDATVAKVWSPYLDAGKPAVLKHLQGLDVSCEGTWQVMLAMMSVDSTASDQVATLARSTFGEGRIPAEGAATHVAIRFESQGVGPHKLSSALLHFTSDQDED